jgi:predicted RNA-binding protein with RPS1 domain
MSITVSEKGKWNELVNELEKVVRENNSKPKEERKSLSMIFREFAEKHNTTASSTGFYYYDTIKPKLENEEKTQSINIDESISNYANSNLKDPRNFYKIGDVVEVEVTRIVDFGAFTKTKEGFEGLIHISEITGKEFVDIPEDFFYVGEKVRAKVKRIKIDGEIDFSTRALGGKSRVNPAFKDIAKTKLEASPIKVIERQESNFIRVEPTPTPKPVVEEVKSSTHPDDRDNIINFIKKYSDNNVSAKALTDIDEMVANFGVFQTTISLMEVVRDLDISSFITNMTKEKLGLDGDSLRRS